MVGEDDLYPKDWRGEPVLPTRFVIRAEKCPNRRGVEAVLEHFQQPIVTFESVLAKASASAKCHFSSCKNFCHRSYPRRRRLCSRALPLPKKMVRT
jgi:hypothetical protein